MRGRAGVTLVELLIAAAIMSVVLAALGGLFVSSSRANQVNTRISVSQQHAEAAVQLLKNELALAGYRGTDAGASTRAFPTGTRTLEVAVESGTRDRVTVRFFPDRTHDFLINDASTNPPLRTVVFGVNAASELTRQQTEGATVGATEAVVEGVTGLKVTGYLLRSGGSSADMPTDRASLAGLTLRLTLTDATTRNVTIALNNLQR